MRLFPYRTPRLLQTLYPSCQWKKTEAQQTIYLTFDDGPDENATNYVLETLDRFDARATFFVVGENVRLLPEVTREIVARGHSLGNHTQHHLSGWRCPRDRFVENVWKCQHELVHTAGINSRLFRPPYGRITPPQLAALKGQFEIVMWSLLSGDFDSSFNADRSLNALSNARSGDILVFHDNTKYLHNLKQVLEPTLQVLSAKGFMFAAL